MFTGLPNDAIGYGRQNAFRARAPDVKKVRYVAVLLIRRVSCSRRTSGDGVLLPPRSIISGGELDLDPKER